MAPDSGRPLILASRSPQRQRLLKSLGVPFHVRAARIRENSAHVDPRRLVLDLALRKAMAVAKRVSRALVLGADTVVSCRGSILLKPADAAHCLRMLSALNGRWHRVYTGVALVDAETGRSWQEAAVTRVKAKKLPEESLRRLAGKHMDKSGGYAVQDRQDPFIERWVGPHDNIIGLPLANVRSLIRKAARARRAGSLRTRARVRAP